jgi:hypothetical protein
MGKKATILPPFIRPLRPMLSDEDVEIDSDLDPEILDTLDKEYQKPNYFDMGKLNS